MARRSHGSPSRPGAAAEDGASGLSSGCCFRGSGRLPGGLPSSSLPLLLDQPPADAGDGGGPILPAKERGAATLTSSRPGWYKELFARAMNLFMKPYEAEVAGYKEELFAQLRGQNKKILELGVGTGPNLKYYAGASGIDVFAVDPNERMEKYARAAATSLGLPPENFNFVQGFAEALPIRDNSMDAVVGTLVLCSVRDVDAVLREIRRVLKPGGIYIFMEHVAAQDGSLLRLFQGVFNPLQQLVADGCHLVRETEKNISLAGFSDVHVNRVFVSAISNVGPHIYGFARK